MIVAIAAKGSESLTRLFFFTTFVSDKKDLSVRIHKTNSFPRIRLQCFLYCSECAAYNFDRLILLFEVHLGLCLVDYNDQGFGGENEGRGVCM